MGRRSDSSPAQEVYQPPRLLYFAPTGPNNPSSDLPVVRGQKGAGRGLYEAAAGPPETNPTAPGRGRSQSTRSRAPARSDGSHRSRPMAGSLQPGQRGGVQQPHHGPPEETTGI